MLARVNSKQTRFLEVSIQQEINSIIAEAVQTAENLASNFGMYLDCLMINIDICHIGRPIHEIRAKGTDCFYIASKVMNIIQHQMPIADLNPDEFFISIEIVYGK